MKSFVVAILVAVLLVGGSVGYSFFMKNTAELIEEKAVSVEKLVESGDFEGAKSKLSEFHDTLDEKNSVIGSVIEHKEIFEIKRNMAEIEVFLDSENKEESLSRIKSILAVLKQLSDNSALGIYNIL